jgi:hypothetical protein
MEFIGRRIYFDIATGNVLVDTGDRAGDLIPTTVEYDLQSYAVLAERVPNTVGCLQLEYGEDSDKFAQYQYRVDPAKLTIIWDLTPPTASLEQVKQAKIDFLNGECYKTITAGFQSIAIGQTHTYPSDDEAQRNLSFAIKRLELEPELQTVDFKTLDAGYLPHTLDQIHKVFKDGFDYGQQQVIRYNVLKAQVLAAETKEEIDAINW